MKKCALPVDCGFTLIEVVISSALMALILVSAYLCLSAGFAAQKLVEPRADVFQSARVTMALVTADLRGACTLPGDSAFLGMKRMIGDHEADNLDFATHNYTPRRAHEADFCEVSYYVDQDPQSGELSLWRRSNPTLALDPLSGGSRREITPNIIGVRYEFSDGQDWYDEWGEVKGAAKAGNSQRQQNNLEGLPEAVRITLLMDPSAKPGSRTNSPAGGPMVDAPLVFQTVVSLNLADANQGNSDVSTGQALTGAPSGGIQQ